MKDSFERVYQAAAKYNTTLRIGAYIVAIEKVAQTYHYRGGY
jgi:glutamate dehydrogenase (NAD(P)+)